jgi:hypothetical protein
VHLIHQQTSEGPDPIFILPIQPTEDLSTSVKNQEIYLDN